MRRCTNPRAANYHKYGGRGITVCARWLDVRNFVADMGERPPGTSLDRIDSEKGYSPDNCRWATPTTQNRNRSCTTVLTVAGCEKPLTAWAAQYGIQPGTIRARLRSGWSDEEAVTRPVAGA